MMWLWMLPSITALCIKCLLFFHADIRQQRLLLCLMVSFFCLNLLELIGFFLQNHQTLWLRFYYCIVVFCSFYLVSVCATTAQYCQWLKSNLIKLTAVTFACYIFFTDHIVLGFEPLANGAITRIAGAHYYLIQLYVITTLLFATSLLTHRLIKSNDYYLQARCTIALVSFLPTITVVLVILGLMQLEYKISMVGVLSLSSCFMLLIFIPLSNEEKLFHTMKFVPFTRERRNSKKLKNIIRKLEGPMRGESIDLKALLKELETQLIVNTNIYFSTQRETANQLNISESSLSRKIELQHNKSSDLIE